MRCCNHDSPNELFYNLSHEWQKYYTYKKSSVRFFALDSNYMDSTALWLEKELQNSGSIGSLLSPSPALFFRAFHGSSNDIRLLLNPCS